MPLPSYGQIARLIGRPKNARLVGKVLKDSQFYGEYPCHRVVNHAGASCQAGRNKRPCLPRKASSSRTTPTSTCAATNGNAEDETVAQGRCLINETTSLSNCLIADAQSGRPIACHPLKQMGTAKRGSRGGCPFPTSWCNRRTYQVRSSDSCLPRPVSLSSIILCSICAAICLVWMTASGLTEMESMPLLMRNSQNSG